MKKTSKVKGTKKVTYGMPKTLIPYLSPAAVEVTLNSILFRLDPKRFRKLNVTKKIKEKSPEQIEATKRFYEVLHNMNWEPLTSNIKARIEANKRNQKRSN